MFRKLRKRRHAEKTAPKEATLTAKAREAGVLWTTSNSDLEDLASLPAPEQEAIARLVSRGEPNFEAVQYQELSQPQYHRFEDPWFLDHALALPVAGPESLRPPLQSFHSSNSSVSQQSSLPTGIITCGNGNAQAIRRAYWLRQLEWDHESPGEVSIIGALANGESQTAIRLTQRYPWKLPPDRVLLIAALFGDCTVAAAQLERGVGANSFLNVPTHLALEHRSMVRAIDAAVGAKEPAMIELLTRYGAQVTDGAAVSFMLHPEWLAFTGRDQVSDVLPTFVALLRAGMSINAKDSLGFTVLDWAVRLPEWVGIKAWVIAHLLNSGAEVRQDLRTPTVPFQYPTTYAHQVDQPTAPAQVRMSQQFLPMDHMGSRWNPNRFSI